MTESRVRAMLELAEQCEKAIFPCPDDATAIEVGAIRSAICHLMTGRGYDTYSPDYIGSLDAAMTLVPEGWSIGLGDLRGHDPIIWRAHLRDHNDPDPSKRQWKEGHAATPALALCAAALRARAADTPKVTSDD